MKEEDKGKERGREVDKGEEREVCFIFLSSLSLLSLLPGPPSVCQHLRSKLSFSLSGSLTRVKEE